MVFFLPFPYDMHFFIFMFFFQRQRLIQECICLSFCLWWVQKGALLILFTNIARIIMGLHYMVHNSIMSFCLDWFTNHIFLLQWTWSIPCKPVWINHVMSCWSYRPCHSNATFKCIQVKSHAHATFTSKKRGSSQHDPFHICHLRSTKKTILRWMCVESIMILRHKVMFLKDPRWRQYFKWVVLKKRCLLILLTRVLLKVGKF